MMMSGEGCHDSIREFRVFTPTELPYPPFPNIDTLESKFGGRSVRGGYMYQAELDGASRTRVPYRSVIGAGSMVQGKCLGRC